MTPNEWRAPAAAPHCKAVHAYVEPSHRLTHAPRKLAPLQAGDVVRVPSTSAAS